MAGGAYVIGAVNTFEAVDGCMQTSHAMNKANTNAPHASKPRTILISAANSILSLVAISSLGETLGMGNKETRAPSEDVLAGLGLEHQI